MVNLLAPPPYKTYTRLPECQRHPEYYLDDGNLILKVWFIFVIYGHQLIGYQAKNTLFRVWDVSFRRHSTQFDFRLRNTTYTWGEIADGTDDDHPLELHGVEASDVECFLWVIYPP